MKKKIIIFSILLALLVSICGFHIVRNNYELGREMYLSAKQMSFQCNSLADSLDYLEMKFSDPNISDISFQGFYNAIFSITSRFGFKDNPLQENIYEEYTSQFYKLRDMAQKDGAIERAFADETKRNEIIDFKNALRNLAEQLNIFISNYDQMSFLETCFTSWSNERDMLSEKVKLSQ